MCGIVGYVNAAGASQRAAEGLALLEYRGYDSYGLAVNSEGVIVIEKAVGSIGQALAAGKLSTLPVGTAAIAHTRWATHGGVTAANAHPHLSYDREVAVVHNGVIDNYLPLRRELEAEGVSFLSQTDTEVVTHLIAREYARTKNPLMAVVGAISQLQGEYALAILFASEPDVLYGARHKSPLLVAYNDNEAMLASDPAPVLDLSPDVIYLEDGDIVRLAAGGVTINHITERGFISTVQRAATAHAAGVTAPSRGEHEHWMLKEILEVPTVITTATLIPYAALTESVAPGNDLTLIGSGSAFYVARLGQYFLNKLLEKSVHALPSDEAPYWATFGSADTVIAISQSGETFDTLEVCRQAKDLGSELTAITNVSGSTLERLADHTLSQNAGAEICVLSTKSVISQVAILIRLAYALGYRDGAISKADYYVHEIIFERVPAILESIIADLSGRLQELARDHAAHEHWFFIGRGPLYPVALESALKFKEVSYHHAEGLPAGFFKHGTISLIDEDFYTVALLPAEDADHERLRATLANVSEIAARQGPVIGFGPESLSADDRANFREYVGLPLTGDDGSDLLIHLLVGQLFSYYCALELGREIDQPRSLAKSVTVR